MKKKKDLFTNDEIVEAAEYLIGTMETLDSFLSQKVKGATSSDLTNEQFRIYNDIVFRCSYCEWNYDASEQTEVGHGELVCESCLEYHMP